MLSYIPMDILNLPHDLWELMFFANYLGASAACILYHVCRELRQRVSGSMKESHWEKKMIVRILQRKAAKHGNWKVVKFTIMELHSEPQLKTIRYAIRQHRNHILQLEPVINYLKRDSIYDKEIFCDAVANNSIDTLSYLMKNLGLTNYSINDLCLCASEANNLPMLQWIFSTMNEQRKKCYGSNARGLDNEMLGDIVSGGSLVILEWALTQVYGTNIRISLSMYMNAVEGGHLHILKWYEENGYQKKIPSYGDDDLDLDLDNRAARRAALHGHTHILRWIHEKKCNIDYIQCFYNAMHNGCGEVFHQLVEWGYPIPDDILSKAERREYMRYDDPHMFSSDADEIIEWLLLRGFRPTMKVTKALIRREKIDLLEKTVNKSFYAENAEDLVMDSLLYLESVKWFVQKYSENIDLNKIFTVAVKGSHNDVVIWLAMEKGIKINSDIFEESDWYLDEKMFIFLHRFCDINIETLLKVLMGTRHLSPNMTKYLIEIGYEYPYEDECGESSR